MGIVYRVARLHTLLTIRRTFSNHKMKFIDIGANLTDPVFRGIYHNNRKHADDFDDVLERAKSASVNRMIITGGSLEDSNNALKLSQTADSLYCTVGCHPTRCDAFLNDPDKYLDQLVDLANSNKDKVVAAGEFGLDYDRTRFCSKETQRKYFEKQFDLVERTGLPMFLHSRACSADFISILKRNLHRVGDSRGVVHSFTGTAAEAEEYMGMGFHIGINGCSLKTQDNIDVVKTIPSDRLLLETDCPWCEVKPTSAGFPCLRTKYPTVKKERWVAGSCVKGRVEPCHIVQVLEVVAGCRGVDVEELSDIIYRNTLRLFFHGIENQGDSG